MISKTILFIVSLIFLLNIGLNSSVAAEKKAVATMLPPLATTQEKQDYLKNQKQTQTQTKTLPGVKASHVLVPIEFTDPDLSVATVRTYLITDYDADNFYSEFSKQVDVDTTLTTQDVYIDFFIRYPGGAWEYLNSSDVFTLDGNSVLDTVEIATTLVDGYIPDYYDVRIDVHDAMDPRYGVSYGPADFPALEAIPLEDEYEDDDDVYLGSTGFVTLLLLASLMLWRLRNGQGVKQKI